MGRSKKRGNIALGEVLSNQELLSGEKKIYWNYRDMAKKVGQRVAIRYFAAPSLPKWIVNPDSAILEELSVARYQGGKAFIVMPEQWASALNLIGG